MAETGREHRFGCCRRLEPLVKAGTKMVAAVSVVVLLSGCTPGVTDSPGEVATATASADDTSVPSQYPPTEAPSTTGGAEAGLRLLTTVPCPKTAVVDVKASGNKSVSDVVRSTSGLVACVISVGDATVNDDLGLSPEPLKITAVTISLHNPTTEQLPVRHSVVNFTSQVPKTSYSFANVDSVLPSHIDPGATITARFHFSNTSAERDDYMVQWGDVMWWEKPLR